MSRVAAGFAIAGVSFVLAGLTFASALGDRFVGLGLLLVGAFLLFLPLTRPSAEE